MPYLGHSSWGGWGVVEKVTEGKQFSTQLQWEGTQHYPADEAVGNISDTHTSVPTGYLP